MNKEGVFHSGGRTFVVIMLSVLMCSCKGQEKKSRIQHDVAQTQISSQYATRVNGYRNEQISQVVRMMFQDSKGNIWFGTEDGAFKLTDTTLIHIDNVKSASGQGVTIKDITEDTYGTIWFGHTDGISCIKGDSVLNYDESDGLISHDVWCITADHEGKIWVGTLDGISVYNKGIFTNVALPEGKKDTTMGVSSARMVHHILEDKKGRIWISSNAGLFSYDENVLTDETERLGIKTNFVNRLFEDKDGGLWISTKGGLYYLKENVSKNITDGKVDIGKGIGSVAEDKSGRIWFVSNQHDLYTFDGSGVEEFQKPEDEKGPVVFQIYKDQDDRLWFVGYGGAYRMENGKFLHITRNGPW